MERNQPKLIINGGNTLNGEVSIEASKNSVLPILSACVMSKAKIKLLNCTPIVDVNNMLEILRRLGAQCSFEEGTISVDCSSLDSYQIDPQIAMQMRSSLFLLGSMLSRFKLARATYPGGCNIGSRPIDLHLDGLRAFNVRVTEQNGEIICDGTDMKPSTVTLRLPSVGATENLMMASVFLDGTSYIINAAKEPEIVDLARFINRLGGRVSGAGTHIIRIDGVSVLSSGAISYKPIADRIISGTYLVAVASCGGNVFLRGANATHLKAPIKILASSGAQIHSNQEGIQIVASGLPKSVKHIRTDYYPKFATDLQAQFTVLMSVADKSCVITENLFETRFKHIEELNKMGANITVRGRNAYICGTQQLFGCQVEAQDLRGGASLVLAGLRAKGQTEVLGLKHIERGYYRIEEALRGLGADIIKIT